MDSVYLAGPISGCSYEGCTSWRAYVKEELLLAGIRSVSPMRGKEELADIKELDAVAYEGPLVCPKGITTRDRWDATHCPLLFVNLLGAERVSIGTVMEIAWADLLRTPIVLVMEPGNPHEHCILNEVIGFRTSTLDRGIEITKHILGDHYAGK